MLHEVKKKVIPQEKLRCNYFDKEFNSLEKNAARSSIHQIHSHLLFVNHYPRIRLRGCSYEKNQPGKTGCLGLPRSRLYYEFLIKIFELSYEKRAGPANRDLALYQPRSRQNGVFFSHMTAPARLAGLKN